MLVGSPSFALDTTLPMYGGKTEAQFLAASITDVARHYNPRAFDQKTLDWANLIQCLALVYGPRLYNMRSERQARRAAQARPMPKSYQGPRPVDPQPAAAAAMNGQSTEPSPFPNEMRRGEIPGIGEVELPENWFGKPN